MEGSEYLYTVAEVAVAFVGFAAIAIAIRLRSENLDDFGRLSIEWLVERGLASLAFAFLPMLLYYFDVSSEKVLPLCSGLLAIYLLTVFVRMFNGRQAYAVLSDRGSVAPLVLVGAMVPVQALAALGVLPFGALGWYLLGVSWLLVISALVFATIITLRAA